MNKHFSFIYLLLFVIAFFGSFYLFTLPGNSLPTIYWLDIPFLDKYIHAGIFFILCFTATIAWKVNNRGKINLPITIGIILFFISYGIGIEFYQENYVEGRAFELLDFVADTIGCMLFLCWFVIGGFSKKVGPDRNRDLNQN
ncbi:MAG: hypothetical protein EAZ12_07785 [Sphingobacteriia bacterium]|nr:MAG: hypothetical protein EAZ12_07785 [Sphingobacteriia bacterium]